MLRSFTTVTKTLTAIGLLSVCGAAYAQQSPASDEEGALLVLIAGAAPQPEGSYQTYSAFQDARCAHPSGPGRLATLPATHWNHKSVLVEPGARLFFLAELRRPGDPAGSQPICRHLVSFAPPTDREYDFIQWVDNATSSCTLEVVDPDRGRPPPDLQVEDPQICPVQADR